MINFEELNRYMDNDPVIIQMVFLAYLEEYSDASNTIINLYNNESWSELFIFAHSLKGVLSSFGVDAVVERLKIIEASTNQHIAPSEDQILLVSEQLIDIKKKINGYLTKMA
ncbi:hypothetical protein BS333_18285 [Vibrio azureus]|uniref:HPt domain-containing protein n=1 Tax=Vibrio azureus NBRC 104587 TaxID=1219077 RepID=U3CEK6_9VIBR|nr:Hpt domain-containing protein [Vibrio azureus]AUI88290.1 hypothetical protein BS333_18285 [Vibrio azureus]GAD76748.1 hypothetical protein VAZ01S_051_00130 [Vibrio azureus NBRC 104587]